MTTPVLDQFLQECNGLKQLPDFVVRLLDMLRDPVETGWGGRKGYEHHCAFCGARKEWGKDLTHRNNCRWVGAMQQAEALRSAGVLPPKPAVKATA